MKMSLYIYICCVPVALFIYFMMSKKCKPLDNTNHCDNTRKEIVNLRNIVFTFLRYLFVMFFYGSCFFFFYYVSLEL